MALRPLCAICDNTNATLRLCDTCRRDKANADWSEGEDLADYERVSAEDVDFSRMNVGSVFDTGPKLKPVGVVHQKVLALLYHFTIRVPLRNRGQGRRRGKQWSWESRGLNLREVAWLVGIARQTAEWHVRSELQLRYAQRREIQKRKLDSGALKAESP